MFGAIRRIKRANDITVLSAMHGWHRIVPRFWYMKMGNNTRKRWNNNFEKRGCRSKHKKSKRNCYNNRYNKWKRQQQQQLQLRARMDHLHSTTQRQRQPHFLRAIQCNNNSHNTYCHTDSQRLIRSRQCPCRRCQVLNYQFPFLPLHLCHSQR